MIALHGKAGVRGMTPDEAAIHWLMLFADDGNDVRMQADFEKWLSKTPANAAAFQRANEVWAVFDDANSAAPLDAIRESAWAGAGEKNGIWRYALVAAALIAAFMFSIQFGTFEPVTRTQVASQTEPVATQTARLAHGQFRTVKGEQRTVELNDGTILILNTESAVEVSYTPERRFIRQLKGQVLFNVAKDYNRPFVVEAAKNQITALGTIFEVRVDRDNLKVTLVEGKIVVDAPEDRSTDRVAMAPTVLTPGDELVAKTGAVPRLAKVDVDQGLRWRQGFVEFSDTTLANAVEEMNRYSTRQIVFADAATRELRISGTFRTGNSERFAAIVGELLPVQSHRLDTGHIEMGPVTDPKAGASKRPDYK